MPSFLNANNLQPFVDQDIKTWTELVEYEGLNGTIKTGYNAKLLRGICNVYLDARKSGALLKSQERTAEVSEQILYALADKGIESLVDDATGFNRVKEEFKDRVVLFLEKSLQLEPAQLVKTFGDDFFEMIFRMKGWTWTNSAKRPGVVGHYINDLVYSRIAPNVLNELKKLNPKIGGNRRNKHHQHLTEDFGHPLLKEHLAAIVALGRASGFHWGVFNDLVNRAYPKYGQTLHLDIAVNYDRRLSEKKEDDLSSLNRSLKIALEYNPREQKE